MSGPLSRCLAVACLVGVAAVGGAAPVAEPRFARSSEGGNSTSASDRAGAHSCYFYIVHVSDCKPSKSKTGIAQCLSCAAHALPHEPATGYEHCTQKLIDDACHGILPPHPSPSPPSPPAPPKASDMVLTLLPDAAKEKGAVCLDGSPAGCACRRAASPTLCLITPQCSVAAVQSCQCRRRRRRRSVSG